MSETEIKGIIYLGAPYTHLSPEIRLSRFEKVTCVAAKLIEQGLVVYSPITMTHPIDIVLSGHASTMGSDYWVAFDEAFMEFCSELVVLKLDGWEDSSGLAREIDYFRKKGRTVKFIDP